MLDPHEMFASREFWIAAAVIAVFFYWLGRSHAGGETGAERQGRIAAERIQAAAALKALAPDQRKEIDGLLRGRQKIAAIKLIRELTGLGLKEAKDAAEQRLAELAGG